MRANLKRNPQLEQITARYVVDNEIAPNDLTGAGAKKALDHANSEEPTTSTGAPAFDIAALDGVREVLIDSLTSSKGGFGTSSQSSSMIDTAVQFGGSSSVNSPAYSRLNLEPESKATITLAQLTSGDGEQPVFQRLGDALERNFAAIADARTTPRGRAPQLENLVKNRTFAKGLVDLIGLENPGDLGDAMGDLGKKAGPELAKYWEGLGEDVEVYQQTQAPRPKSEPELTAFRSALELAVMDVQLLEIPVENIFRSEGGRAAFASFVKDIVGQSSVSDERREKFSEDLYDATPIELKPMLFSRVELGETLAGEAFDKGDLAAFTSLLGSSERPRAMGAYRKAEQLLQDGAPGAKEFGAAALAVAKESGAVETASRLELALQG